MKKFAIFAACITLIGAFAIGAAVYKNKQSKVSYIEANYAIDIDDPAAVVGSQDYVFVCEVLEVKDCNTEISKEELPETIIKFDTPMTKCTLKVLKNLKGNLKEGETITFYKNCGYDSEAKVLYLYEKDLMPEEHKVYIFMGYGHYDGTMTGGGDNGTIFVCNSDESYSDTEVYKQYVQYVNNQLDPPIPFPHYLAYADVNFGDGSINKTIRDEFNSSDNKVTGKSLEELVSEKLDYASKHPVAEYTAP